MTHISMKSAGVMLAAAVLTTAAPNRAEAGFIVNGSFESPAIPFSSYVDYSAGDTSITGWTISGQYVEIDNYNGVYPNQLDTPYGAQWLWLGGYESLATISQTVTGLTVGTTYQLSFAISSELPALYGYDAAVVTIDQGGTPLTQTFTDNATLSSPNSGWGDWSTHSWQFVASSTSATVSFAGETGHFDGDVGLDNVDLTEVQGPVAAPAPPGLLLGLSGLASLGGFGWLRRRRLAAAA